MLSVSELIKNVECLTSNGSLLNSRRHSFLKIIVLVCGFPSLSLKWLSTGLDLVMLEPSLWEALLDTRGKVIMTTPYNGVVYCTSTFLIPSHNLFCFSLGSVMSLIAGLLFGCISAYGAYRVSNEPREVAVSLCK